MTALEFAERWRSERNITSLGNHDDIVKALGQCAEAYNLHLNPGSAAPKAEEEKPVIRDLANDNL
jgi:predicted neuraminidase